MKAEIVWSPLALARLQEIRAYIALVYVNKDKPDAAERLAMRIVAVVEALRNHPRLGRAGTEPGIRELVIGGTPYVVLYRVRGQRVIITTIWHGAQRKSCEFISAASRAVFCFGCSINRDLYICPPAYLTKCPAQSG